MTKILPAGARYFAAANTGGGFISYYEKIFPSDDFDHLMIVKGGSGTGKSAFLRTLGETAETQGDAPEYFFCASDPSSLDGVIFTHNGRRYAAIDGTAPHLRDTELPGACDVIHNAGSYWDTEVLAAGRAEISALSHRRAAGYAAAYDYLAAAGRAAAAAERILAAHTDTAKLGAAVERLLRGSRAGGTPAQSIRPLDSFGMEGAVRFDSFAARAQTVFRVVGYGASLFLAALRDGAVKRGLSLTSAPASLDPSRLSALLLPDCAAAFVAEERGFVPSDGERIVNMERFVHLGGEEERTALRRALKLKKAALLDAKDAFAGIRATHFKLEQLYAATMDFERKTRDEAVLIEKIFS